VTFQPRSLRNLLIVATVMAASLCCTIPAKATIRYDISLAHPEQHVFAVTMTIPDVHNEIIVQMPAWNALYQIRDFSGHVAQVAAFADGRSPKAAAPFIPASPSSKSSHSALSTPDNPSRPPPHTSETPPRPLPEPSPQRRCDLP